MAESERRKQKLEAEAKQERKKLDMETQLAEAHALRENPELLKILKLRTLSDMANQGGKFVIGLKDELLD